MHTSPDQLKEVLKKQLKLKGLSYTDLADHLKVSEVTVKRMMSKEEIPLSRFLTICEWLEISLTELEKIASYTNINQIVRFTEDQEKFLAKNPTYLAFLFQLYTQETPEQIQKNFQLTQKSLNLYLLRLENVNLIKKVAGRYKLVHKDFPSPIKYGELAKSQSLKVLETGLSLFTRYNKMMVQRKNEEADRGSQTKLSVFCLQRQSYLAWFEKYKEIMQELIQISEVEEKIPELKQKTSVVMLHLHALVDEKDPEIEGIKNMFGRPANVT